MIPAKQEEWSDIAASPPVCSPTVTTPIPGGTFYLPLEATRLSLFELTVFPVKDMSLLILLARLPFHEYVGMCPAHPNLLNLTTLTLL